MSTVLLFGNLRSSLALARSLGKAGHAIHCGIDEPYPYLMTSRHVVGTFHHARSDHEPEKAMDSLLAYLDQVPEIDVVAPVSEIALRLLSRQRDRLPQRVRLLAPPAQVVETCVDKAVMFDLCERLGVALAKREIVTDHAELLSAIGRIGRPCIVKPVDSSNYLFERKAIVLRPEDKAEMLLPHWPSDHRSLCVQRFVGGHRHDISFAAVGGRLIGAVDCRVLRTDREDGTGYTTVLESARAAPEVSAGLETLVAALNYTGVGDIEFMVDDASGEVSFIELNPRLSASYRSAEICGLPLSTLMLQLGSGEALQPRSDPWDHPTGRRIVWLKGEVSGVRRRMTESRLGAYKTTRSLLRLLATASARHHLTFDPNDPLPSLWIYLHPVLRRLGLKAECKPNRDRPGETRAATRGSDEHPELDVRLFREGARI